MDQMSSVPLHPPHFGATVKSVDASNAKRIPGVVQVVRFSGDAFRFEEIDGLLNTQGCEGGMQEFAGRLRLGVRER